MTSSNPGELDSELESFRQKWLSDLRTKTEHHDAEAQPAAAGPSRRPHHGPPISSLPQTKHVPAVAEENDDDYIPSKSFDDPGTSSSSLTRPAHEVQHDQADKSIVSALDHFEEAMYKEAQGNMGDSLKLYRRAYRLDNGVDRRYREKHFPQKSAPRPTSPVETRTAATATTAPKADATEDAQPLPIGELIASFSSLKIEPVPAPVEGMPQPPCPLADLPDEILIHILHDVAITDVGDFARLSRVCKRLAYLVATEQRIWRRIALGSEVGFSTMLYRFEKAIEWDPLPEEEQDEPEIVDGIVTSPAEIAQRRHDAKLSLTESLTPSVYPTWKTLFRSRPRIRFNGCYISTVNYVRTGQASTNQATWGNPIHIVTYYRYLRFFRDGTLISLLSTTEPADVVHHLTRQELNTHRNAAHPHLPSAVMALALRGRWRLSSAADREDPSVLDRPTTAAGPNDRDRGPEGDVFIETEGVGSKYMYRMDLSMRSAGKGARNNKLVWRGFYSYNKLTDDWGEFGLKNDKPYFFSRVKSYGFAG
ncbi:hypothetical protein FZEAL_3368 [Fusarium zealandicum]|uniref:F-box domain-containing protein n=1 Tax=Fusarium zealandicum TaxID=1053134 RepID=A0A8H4UP15_9HYPO|nr:hypothetical protein FZEAL_3368 [Fusarium zealandicum]